MIAERWPLVRFSQSLLIWPIIAAWGVAVLAEFSGRGAALHHDRLIERGNTPLWVAFVLFLLGWQVMIAAMMLPSSLPLIQLFQRASASQRRARFAQIAFLSGYVAVWTAFGALAFLGDIGIHRAVDRVWWLHDRSYLIGGAVLLLAGAFQFSGLKEKCLDQCRHPGAYLLLHYGQGVGAAFRLGRGHGLFCLGCCWALMLVSFAAGIANLAWMAVLTLLMVFEKTGKGGNRAAEPVGFGLIALGVLVLWDPGWLPTLFGVH
jgi:predicted metal-binding membrane protein